MKLLPCVYSCTPCDCSSAGSINGTCNPVTGQCDCKQFVTGRQCDECVTGASDLHADNPFGCSKGKWVCSYYMYVCVVCTFVSYVWLRHHYVVWDDLYVYLLLEFNQINGWKGLWYKGSPLSERNSTIARWYFEIVCQVIIYVICSSVTAASTYGRRYNIY